MLQAALDQAMSRALLTAAEREALQGDGDDDSNKRSTYRSRVRQRVPELATDLEILREHEPDLYETVLAGIAPEDPEARMTMAAALLTRSVEDEE